MVMPWDCSFFSASNKKAYSKRFGVAFAAFPNGVQLAFGQESVSASMMPDDGAFSVVHMAHDNNVHDIFQHSAYPLSHITVPAQGFQAAAVFFVLGAAGAPQQYLPGRRSAARR